MPAGGLFRLFFRCGRRRLLPQALVVEHQPPTAHVQVAGGDDALVQHILEIIAHLPYRKAHGLGHGGHRDGFPPADEGQIFAEAPGLFALGHAHVEHNKAHPGDAQRDKNVGQAGPEPPVGEGVQQLAEAAEAEHAGHDGPGDGQAPALPAPGEAGAGFGLGGFFLSGRGCSPAQTLGRTLLPLDVIGVAAGAGARAPRQAHQLQHQHDHPHRREAEEHNQRGNPGGKIAAPVSIVIVVVISHERASILPGPQGGSGVSVVFIIQRIWGDVKWPRRILPGCYRSVIAFSPAASYNIL